MDHISATVDASPTLSNNFDGAVAFIVGQMNRLRLLNGSRKLNISAVGTGNDTEDKDDDDDTVVISNKKNQIKSLRRKIKSFKLCHSIN